MKEKAETGQQSNVVYSIPCKMCSGRYFGETIQRLWIRAGQHRKNVENAKQKPKKSFVSRPRYSEQNKNLYKNIKVLVAKIVIRTAIQHQGIDIYFHPLKHKDGIDVISAPDISKNVCVISATLR